MRPGRDGQRARDEIEERGLPRPVGADQRAPLSRLHLEAHAIHGAKAAEVLGHALEPERELFARGRRGRPDPPTLAPGGRGQGEGAYSARVKNLPSPSLPEGEGRR